LLLVLLFFTALLFAPFTQPGSRALLGMVDRFSPLEIEYGSGTLNGQLRINRLVLTTASVTLQLRDVVAVLAPGCLWRSAICFSQLQAGHLDIAVLPGAEEEPSQGKAAQDGSAKERTDSELIVFPFAVEANDLELESTRIHWRDGEWRQGPASIQLRISGSTIEVSSAVIAEAHLELREARTAKKPVSDAIILPRIDLPLELKVGELLLQRPSWNLYGTAQQLQSIVLQGSWRNTQLQLTQLGAASTSWGELSGQGALQFDSDWPLQTSLDVSLAQSPALWPGLHGRRLALSAQGTLASLTLDLVSLGTPELTIEAQLNTLDRQLPFSASARVFSPQALRLADFVEVPEALADVLVESPLVMSAEGSLLAEGSKLAEGFLPAQQFKLLTVVSGLGYESLELALTGRHEQGLILLEDLQLRDLAGTNELRGAGEILLSDELRWAVQLNSSGFDLPQLSEFAFGRLQGTVQVNGTVQDATWRVLVDDVDLRGDINGLPARINGFGGLGSGLLLSNSNLRADLNGAQLLLQSSGVRGQPGRLELTVADLGRWQPGSRGQLQLQALWVPDKQQLQISGSLQDIEWAGLAIDEGIVAGNYSVAAEPTFNLDIAVENAVLAGVELSSMQLLLGGTLSQHQVSVISRGDVQGELQLAGSLQDQQWSGRLAPTSLRTPFGIWQLTEAVRAAWPTPRQQLVLDAHCWQQRQTRVCPGELLLGAQGSGSLEVVGDLNLFEGLLPPHVELEGDLKLQLEGSWDAGGSVVVKGHSRTRSLLLTRHHGEGETASIGWDKGEGVFGYDGEGLNLDWELHREGHKLVDLQLLLPPHRDEAMAGSVSFERIQLGALASFAPSLSALEGEVSGRVHLAGTADQPLASGMLQLSGGRLAMVANPTELNDLNLTLQMQGDRAQVHGSAVLGGGELQLVGELVIRPELRLQLAVNGTEHNILYPPSTELRVSQNLDITVSRGLLDVTGEIVVHEGVLEFEQLPAGSVALSSDVVQVDYTGAVIREELPFDISMDVWVRIQDRFKVTGSILQATLGGDLQLLQQAGQPLQLFGSLNTIGGEVRAYQQQLRIKRGVLSFTGTPDNPALDVRAQRDISGNNVTVGVQVRGRLQEDLVLEIYSDPAMSQGEAMSYLVRGRGMDAGAGADGTAVALSVASGVVNRSTLVSELNRIPGVSNVAFGAEGSEDDTAATVSGYVGERLYLSYGFGLYQPINVLTARLYLGTRLWLEVVSSLENSVDLYYSFDID
jgi:autotransporter translocation and assembly factor TamB